MKSGLDLTCVQASSKETSQLMNGTMQYRPRLLWLGTLEKHPRSFTGTSFGFFLKNEEFVSKTINDSSIDLDKFPASKVRQLAKKMESSKVTARHIKQGASDPQAAQINLIRYQCTDLPASKAKKRKPFVKPRPPSHKNDTSDRQSHYKKSFVLRMFTRTRRDVKSVEIQITLKVSSVQPRSFIANLVISMGTSQASVTRRNKIHSSQENQRLICYKLVLFMLVINPYAATQKIVHPVVSHSVSK